MSSADQRAWVARALIGLVGVMLTALIGRLAYLEAEPSPELRASLSRQNSTIPLPARRGAILDRRHRVLAGSHDSPTIYADPRQIDDPEDFAEKVGPVLDLPAAEVLKLLSDPAAEGYVQLRRGVTEAQGDACSQLKSDEGFRGLGIRFDPVRTYPMGTLAAHVVGFVGSDGKGLEGIELSLEKYLRGQPGRRVVLCDVRRRAMYQQPDSYVAPRDGVNVVLTIDSAIQEIVEREVRRQVEQFKAQAGLGVVMDPKTGEILAMADYPTFDPAQAGTAVPDVRRNRVLTDPVEPGSVFKPYVMSAVLAAGLAKPEEVVFCWNGLYVTGKRFLHDHRAYGSLSVADILAQSSNIGMAILGQRLGNKRMYEALRAYGFGQQTGIDLPGESEGLMMPLKAWDSYTTTSVPMGQELAVTPIQVVTAFSSLVNGGRLLRPRVVRSMVDSQEVLIEDRSKVIDRGQSIDPAAAATMHPLLVKVVIDGTGAKCNLERWQVMGKTGTAQIPRMGKHGYEPDAYLGSFIAAAPASDPAVTVLVMIRKPNRHLGYYGGTVALPGVRAILEQVLPYLNIPPDKTPEQHKAQLASHGASHD